MSWDFSNLEHWETISNISEQSNGNYFLRQASKLFILQLTGRNSESLEK